MEQSGTKKSFGEWMRSRKGQQMLIILAFTIIPLILLLVFTYLPFAEMVKFSFYKMKYLRKNISRQQKMFGITLRIT